MPKCSPDRRRRRSVWLLLTAFVAAWLASHALAAVVFAISDPDALPSIDRVLAYQGVLETGDLLIVVEYDLPYASTPTEIVSDTYFATFRRATTVLNSVEPFAFNNKGYGVGVFSFYWTASEVSTDSIEFSNTNSEDYKVTLQGKVGVFPGSVPSTTTGTITWDTSGTAGLQSYISDHAYVLENNSAWAANSQDLIANTVGVNQLTDTGAEYFSNAVPQSRNMVPDLFPSGVTAIGFTEETFSDSHNNSINDFWATDGNWVDQRFQTLADRYEAPKSVITSMVALFFMFLIVWSVAKVLGNESNSWQFGMMTLALTLPLFGAINWIPMDIVLAVASIGVLGIVWTLFLRRSGA